MIANVIRSVHLKSVVDGDNGEQIVTILGTKSVVKIYTGGENVYHVRHTFENGTKYHIFRTLVEAMKFGGFETPPAKHSLPLTKPKSSYINKGPSGLNTKKGGKK